MEVRSLRNLNTFFLRDGFCNLAPGLLKDSGVRCSSNLKLLRVAGYIGYSGYSENSGNSGKPENTLKSISKNCENKLSHSFPEI